MILDAGGVIVEILATTSGRVPMRSELEGWINTYRLPVTTVMDPAGVGTRTLNTYGIRESLFIVDLRTMRIVNKYLGDVSGQMPPSMSQGIPRMLELLRM
jgi:hypothetical protein